MKRITKLLSACIVSVLLLVFLSFSAFAAETSYSQESFDEYVESVLPELVSVSDAEAADVIAYYNQSGWTGIAEGFQSWVDLKASAGEYQSVGSCTYTVNSDGTVELSAPVTCANATLNVKLVLDTDGYVSSFLFTKQDASNEGTLGSKMKEASVNLVVGMGTVFLVLIFLCWVISLFKNISKIEKKLADKKAAKAGKKEEPAPAAPVTISPAPASNDELEAVIAAAIAAYEADNENGIEKQPALGNGITIKTYRRN